MKQVSLTWSEFIDQYKPITNKFTTDPDFLMFETYGQELEFVQAQDPKHIWTYMDCDNGSVTTEGFHYVNRIGYYITQVPWEDGVSYEVDLEVDTCELCGEPYDFPCVEDDGELTCPTCCEHEGCQ